MLIRGGVTTQTASHSFVFTTNTTCIITLHTSHPSLFVLCLFPSCCFVLHCQIKLSDRADTYAHNKNKRLWHCGGTAVLLSCRGELKLQLMCQPCPLYSNSHTLTCVWVLHWTEALLWSICSDLDPSSWCTLQPRTHWHTLPVCIQGTLSQGSPRHIDVDVALLYFLCRLLISGAA